LLGQGIDVVQFPGVGLQVVQLTDLVRTVDQLPVERTDHRRPADRERPFLLQQPLRPVDVRWVARDVIVRPAPLERARLVESVPSLGVHCPRQVVRLTAQLRDERLAEMGVSGWHAGQFQHRGQHVLQSHRATDDVPCPGAGLANDEWYARQRIVEGAGPLFHEPIVASPVTMVRGGDEAGLRRKPRLI